MAIMGRTRNRLSLGVCRTRPRQTPNAKPAIGELQKGITDMRIHPRFSSNSTASSLSGLALQQAAEAKPQLESGLDIAELMRGLLFRGDRSERTRFHSGILLPFCSGRFCLRSLSEPSPTNSW